MNATTDWLAPLTQFLAMGGYGLYVWGSLGMCAAVAVAEVASLRARRRALAAGGPQEAAPARQPTLTRKETTA